MNKERVLNVLDMIADDMKNDAAEFEGKSFSGAVVGEYFGNIGAAVASLAKIVKAHIKEE